MSLLHVQSEVCIAPFHVRSEVGIASFHVRSKVNKFAPQMDGSNADFAPRMEGSHVDFTPHIEQRKSCRDRIIAKLAILAYYQKDFFESNYFLEVCTTFMTTFENKKKYFEGEYLKKYFFHKGSKE